jgi:hypothetical protein
MVVGAFIGRGANPNIEQVNCDEPAVAKRALNITARLA